MSFLQNIASFSHDTLKRVDTQVTTAEGKRLIETRSDVGSFSQRAIAGQGTGYICDNKPDFQVVEVRPNLLLGSQDLAANIELLEKHHVTHILNFGYTHSVISNVFSGLGSQDLAANLELLEKHHVTHILNVATGISNVFPEEFIYKTVEILDLPETEITRYFDECFEFINAGKGAGKVLVHCNAGVSRSPSVIIAYLMSTEGVSLEHILMELKSLRPAVRPNDGFVRSLEKYEISLKL